MEFIVNFSSLKSIFKSNMLRFLRESMLLGTIPVLFGTPLSGK